MRGQEAQRFDLLWGCADAGSSCAALSRTLRAS